MGNVTICVSSRAVGQKRVPIGFDWTSAAPTSSRFQRTNAVQGRTNPRDQRIHKKGCSSALRRGHLPATPSNPTQPISFTILPNALPLPSHLLMINPLLPPQPFPTHPSHSFTPGRGRSSTSNLLQTTPPALLQSELRRLRVVGAETPEVIGILSSLGCYPKLRSRTSNVSDSGSPSPETFEDALDNFHIAFHLQIQHRAKLKHRPNPPWACSVRSMVETELMVIREGNHEEGRSGCRGAGPCTTGCCLC